MTLLRLPFLTLIALLTTNFVVHAEPLTREIAVKIIAEAEQIRASEVAVGPLQRVERKIDDKTTATGGICATFIAPIISKESGIRRRTVQYRTFFWDDDWGWYLFAVGPERGGAGIDVISQYKGRFLMR